MTAARESAVSVFARLPVAEHALPVGHPAPLVTVEISGFVGGMPSRERAARSSAALGDDLARVEPVPAAGSPQAARARLVRERGSRNSAGLEGDPARPQPALLAAVVGPVGGAREGRSGQEPDYGNLADPADARAPAAPLARKVHARAPWSVRSRRAPERPALQWSGLQWSGLQWWVLQRSGSTAAGGS